LIVDLAEGKEILDANSLEWEIRQESSGSRKKGPADDKKGERKVVLMQGLIDTMGRRQGWPIGKRGINGSDRITIAWLRSNNLPFVPPEASMEAIVKLTFEFSEIGRSATLN